MEHIATPKVENVHLLNPVNLRDSRVGTLYITTTHLIFASPEEKGFLYLIRIFLIWSNHSFSHLIITIVNIIILLLYF